MTAIHLTPALILAILVIPALAVAPKGQPTLVERLEKALKADDKPFTLVIQIHVMPGTEAKVEAAAAKTAKATLTEKGCLAYDFNRDLEKPGHYTLIERWAGLAPLRKHLEKDYTKELQAVFAEVSTIPRTADILAPVDGK
jgi:quinol monooxygenase YgiN